MNPKVRSLLESDIPAIIEISKTTWGGHDHLPSIIDGWISNPLCHPFVLAYDREVVGIASLRIIDEGKTGWMEGLRIHEKFRQKGFGKILTDYLVNVGMNLKLERLRFVTAGDNIAPMKLAESARMQQIDTYMVFWHSNVLDIDWKCDKLGLLELNSKSVLKQIGQHLDIIYMENNPNPSSHSILFHWDVFEVIQKNIDEIANYASFFFGSQNSDATLTIGGEHKTREGIEWCCTIYANSANAFLSGLSKNISLAQNKGIDNIFCIHQLKFKHLYDSIDWLKKCDHELKLVLHERYL